MVDFSAISTEGDPTNLESTYEPFKMLPPLIKEKMCPNNSGIEEDQAESIDSGCVPDIGLSPETNWGQVNLALNDEYNFASSLLQHTILKDVETYAKTHSKLETKQDKKSKKKKKAKASNSNSELHSAEASSSELHKKSSSSLNSNKKLATCIERNEEIASTSKQTNENSSKPIKSFKKLQDRSNKKNKSNSNKQTSEGFKTKKGKGKAPEEIKDVEESDVVRKKELTTLQRELGQELGRLKKGKTGSLTPSQMRHCESKLRKKLKILEKKRKHEEKKKKKTAIELPEKTEQTKKIYNNCGKLVFSKFDFSHPVQSKYTDPKPKTDLNRALNSVLKEKEKIKHLQSTGKVEEAADYMKNIAWTNAVKKVSGQKVKDDVMRLKKAVNRKKLQKMKSKEKWDERNRATQKSKDLRQEKRKRNIEAKKQKRQGKGKGKQKGKERRVPGF